MEKNRQWQEKISGTRRQKLLKHLAGVLGCLVAVGTVGFLVRPAITLTPEPICGKEAHTHTEECYEEQTRRELVCQTPVHHHTQECYDGEGNLICGQSDYVIHSHNEFCYDEAGKLICPLPEIKEHTHTDACYETSRVLVCGQEEIPPHTHGPECYTRVRGERICGQEEVPPHVHTEDCYTIEKKLTCTEDHEHTDACYAEEKVLTCGLEETEGHVHTDECYEWHDELTCGLEETEGHIHTDECYEEQTVFICGKPEVIAHTHGPACYDGEGNLICGLPETLVHSHTADCVKETTEQVLVCGKEEHIHTDECYPIPETTVPETTEGTVPESADGTVPETTEAMISVEAVTENRDPVTGQVLREQTLTAEPGGNIRVQVTGWLPEDARIEAKPVQTELENVRVLLALDISIVLPDGSTYEPPEGALTVEITSPDIDGEGLGVYYVPETGAPEAMPSRSDTGSVSFDTPHFSTYAVVASIPDAETRIDGGTAVDPATGQETQIQWELVQDVIGEYHLRVTGTGPIPDFPDSNGPWYRLYGEYPCHIEIGPGITRVGERAFCGMTMQSISFGPDVRELGKGSFSYGVKPRRIVIPGTVKTIGSSAFHFATAASEIILEEGVEVLGPSSLGLYTGPVHIPASVTSISGGPCSTSGYTVSPDNRNYTAVDGVLYNRDMTVLVDYPKNGPAREFTIPTSVQTVEGSALSGIVNLQKLVIPKTLQDIGKGGIFYNSSLEEIWFEDDMNDSVFARGTGQWFASTHSLRTVHLPENTRIILTDYTSSDQCTLTEFNIPNGVTRINDLKITKSPNLKTLRYDAAQADIRCTRGAFGVASYDLTVGSHVDVLPEGFRYLSESARSLRFEGPNQLTVAPGAMENAPMPFKNLEGTLWVDEQGAVYRYDDTGAGLIYVPQGVQTLTVPASVTPEEGKTLAVRRVEKNTLRYALHLKELTFADPGTVTLEGYALANCPSLGRINGETTLKGAEGLFRQPVGSNAFYNTALGGSSGPDSFEKDMDGKKSLLVTRADASDMSITVSSKGGTAQWMGGETGGYRVLTGDTVTCTVSVGGTEGERTAKYRVYLSYNNDECLLSVEPGKTYTFNGQQITCHGTGDANVVYLEFLPDVGATVSIPVTGVYPSPDSRGGGLTVWGVIVDPDAPAGQIMAPTQGTLQASWRTEPDPFVLKKTDNGQKEISLRGVRVTGPGGEEITRVQPKTAVTWKVQLDRTLDTALAYGKDYVTSVEFTQELILPPGISWNPEVVKALKAGQVYTSKNRLMLDGVELGSIQENRSVSGFRLEWSEESQAPVIRWTWNNRAADAEIGAMDLWLTMEPELLEADMEVYDQQAANTLGSRVTARVHYTHSSDRVLTAEASKEILKTEGKIGFRKTAEGGQYFGEPVTYTLKVYNEGGLPWIGREGHRYTIEDHMDSMAYVSPEGMEAMFREAAEQKLPLTVTIEKACLTPWGQVTDLAGGTAHTNGANTDSPEARTATLTVTMEDNRFRAVTDTGEAYEGAAVAEALQKAGYAVTVDSAYKMVWQMPERPVLEGGETIVLTVPARIKDSLQLLKRDEPNRHPSDRVQNANKGVLYRWSETGERRTVESSSAYVNSRRELYLYKSVSRDGTDLGRKPAAADQDVLDYRLVFDHLGTGTYDDLPLVDDLSGSQYLLVPAAENPELKGLKEYEEDGTVYYCLTEGSYRNVKVGLDPATGLLLTADSVTVEKNPESGGLNTKIKWYYAHLPGETYRREVTYRTLVDFHITGTDRWSIGNWVWLNDRKDWRLYDSLWGGGTILEFDKNIVLQRGNTPAEDQLVPEKFSVIHAGETVTYRLELYNRGNTPYRLNGGDVADALPYTYDVFSWEKGVNVAQLQIVTTDPAIEVRGFDSWYLSQEPYQGLADDGRTYLRFPDEAYIRYPKTGRVYLYLTLTYPDNREGGAGLWDQYAERVGGGLIDNTLYIYEYPSTVSHKLSETGQVLLQKGVSAMGWKDFYAAGKFDLIGDSRRYYNNTDTQNRLIVYYVTLYNGGSGRLYLDTLCDTLPRGFAYQQMLQQGTRSPDSKTMYEVTTLGGPNVNIWGDGQLVSLPADTVYRSAGVRAAAEGQQLTFTLGAGGGEYALKYDEDVQKFYLDNREAIVFGYTCMIGGEADTDAIAANTIGMYYTDVLGAGVEAVPHSRVPVTAVWPDGPEFRYTDHNDGSRQVISAQQARQAYGFPDRGEGSWLVSRAEVRRGAILPGISKYTESYHRQGSGQKLPYEHSVFPDDTVNWRIRLHNDGSLAMWDYTVTDILPAPYEFTGEVRLRLSSAQDSVGEERTLFTVLKVTPEGVELRDGTGKESATALFGGPAVPLENVGTVAFQKNDSGQMSMKLRLPNPVTAVPEGGGRLDLWVSGRNTTGRYRNTVYTNKAVLTPERQLFDSTNNGSILRDETGKAVSVANTAPVTVAFGHATSSFKEVAEEAKPDNRATSLNPERSAIVLPEADSPFVYTLTVNNDTDNAMTKLVLIDNLPQVGDASPFDSGSPRNSEFRVDLASQPDFRVTVRTADGAETVLSSGQYRLEFTERTDFGGPLSEDWTGGGSWNSRMAGARAFRICIEDPGGTLIPSKAGVRVTFRAVAAEDAVPGTTAWNSFGYHYGLLDIPVELEAMPLKVGVRIPSVPILSKEIRDLDGKPVKASRTMTFRFTVSDEDGHTAPVTVEVPAGRSRGRTVLSPELVGWTWVPGARYTVAETDPGPGWTREGWQGGDPTETGVAFRYEPDKALTLTCANRMQMWQLEIRKQDGTAREPLAGAVFALYTGDASEAMSDEAYAALPEQPPRTLEKGWQLMAVETSGEDGNLTFGQLTQAQYYLTEWKAPPGYYPAAPQTVSRTDQTPVTLTVDNDKGFVLPKTGGMGAGTLRALGLVLAAGAALALKKKREGGQDA